MFVELLHILNQCRKSRAPREREGMTCECQIINTHSSPSSWWTVDSCWLDSEDDGRRGLSLVLLLWFNRSEHWQEEKNNKKLHLSYRTNKHLIISLLITWQNLWNKKTNNLNKLTILISFCSCLSFAVISFNSFWALDSISDKSGVEISREHSTALNL